MASLLTTDVMNLLVRDVGDSSGMPIAVVNYLCISVWAAITVRRHVPGSDRPKSYPANGCLLSVRVGVCTDKWGSAADCEEEGSDVPAAPHQEVSPRGRTHAA